MKHSVTIHPESGRLTVDLTTDVSSGTCLVEFGHSFTLRLEEHDLDKLHIALHDAARTLCIERRDTTDLAGRKFVIPEDDFIQRGIDARQQLKVERMMKGTATPTIDQIDTYNPNDPRNW